MRQRSSDAVRKWASKFSAPLEALPSFSYRTYALKTNERHLKQDIASFVGHSVVNSFEATNRSIQQSHESFMEEAPKHGYLAVRAANDEVSGILRVYTLQPRATSQLKDFVGLRLVPGPFGHVIPYCLFIKTLLHTSLKDLFFLASTVSCGVGLPVSQDRLC